MPDRPLRLAVDIGGTFVDAMELDDRTGRVRFRKASTTPDRPWDGVLAAVADLGTDLSQVSVFIHGTTLGLNAVLERRGARTGIVTNDGFRDIFLLGRGNVPDEKMYDFRYHRPPSLVQRRHTAGVRGRLDHRGTVLTELDEDHLRDVVRDLVEVQDVQSLAVCFLHAHRNPAPERRAAELISRWYPDVRVSISTDIAREHREYERTSTTVLEAYIRPIFQRYVDELETGLRDRGLAGDFLIMRSGGGSMTAAAARTSPTHTVLSGPAGGIVGAAHLAELLGRRHLLTFDIGGTSLDACVVEDGSAATGHEAQLERFPLLIPCYDIRTIGAGGGSIARADGGLLTVGPQSAGAMPGPVCYRRGGTEPTVTDASVLLGYVDPASFLAGTMPLDARAAREAVTDRVAQPLGLTPDAAAAGILDVLVARTVGALRQIAVERGLDPRTFTLLAYGGAGPLVAPWVGREMGVAEILVPLAPSGFSAWGMLSADIVDDVSRTWMARLAQAPVDDLLADLAELDELALTSLGRQGVARERARLIRTLELRYLGQEHSLPVTVGAGIDPDAVATAFHELHTARYGHAIDTAVEILALRVRAVGTTARPELVRPPAGDGDPGAARTGRRDAFDAATRATVPFDVYDRPSLAPGDRFAGPALVDEGTCTTVVHGDQQVRVDEYGHLVITTTIPGEVGAPAAGGTA